MHRQMKVPETAEEKFAEAVVWFAGIAITIVAAIAA